MRPPSFVHFTPSSTFKISLKTSQDPSRSFKMSSGDMNAEMPPVHDEPNGSPVRALISPVVSGFFALREEMVRQAAEASNHSGPETVDPSAFPDTSSPAPAVPEAGESSRSEAVLLPAVSDVVPAVLTVPEVNEAVAMSPIAVQPTGSSSTPVSVHEMDTVVESDPVVVPPLPVSSSVRYILSPTPKPDIVLGLQAPSAIPLAPTAGRKRAAPNPDSSRRRRAVRVVDTAPSSSHSALSSKHRSKFVSLIDGMLDECSSEADRLSRELNESKGKLSVLEGKLAGVDAAHARELAESEARVSELERDLGKTASALLKEKKARKSKSSAIRRLERQIGEGSSSRGVEEAKNEMRDALCSEFQTRLDRMSAALDRLSVAHGNDELAADDSDFELILASLKSDCSLLPVPEDPEDAVEGAKTADDAAVSMDEDEAP